MISHTYWQSRFGGAADILQRTIRVGARVHPIVGVMPPGFHFPSETDIWVPQTTSQSSRTGHNFFAVARLKPSVSLEQAQAELTTIAARLEQQYPDSNRGRGVVPVRAAGRARGRRASHAVPPVGCRRRGAVDCLCQHRHAAPGQGHDPYPRDCGSHGARRQPRADRPAIDHRKPAARARRRRRRHPAGVVGRASAGGADVRRTWSGSPKPASMAASSRSPWSCRSAPACCSVWFRRSTRRRSIWSTRSSREARAAAMGGRMVRTRGVLVVSEIALAVVLLTGAGSADEEPPGPAQRRPGLSTGERPGHARPPASARRGEQRCSSARIMSRIGALPGVVAVGATSIPPGDLSNAGDRRVFHRSRCRSNETARVDPLTLLTIVAPGSFAALGIPLRAAAISTRATPATGLWSPSSTRRSFANRLPAQNPIGRTIFCSFDRKDGMTIVGVVGDVRQRNPAIDPMPDCYMPYRQHSYNNAHAQRSRSNGGRSDGPCRDGATSRRPKSRRTCRFPSRLWRRGCRRVWKIRDSARCCLESLPRWPSALPWRVCMA